MAYIDMSANWAYKDLITYQDLNQLGENDKTHVHDGTSTAGIKSGIDVIIAATKKVFLDGAGSPLAGSDTYLLESAADVLDIYVGAANIIKITEDTNDKVEILGADLEVDATKKLYLDGGGDSYIAETAANKIAVYCGGSSVVLFNSGGALETYFAGAIHMNGNVPIYFDGGVSRNAAIANVSGGTGSSALYIGNAQITVASDERIKKDITPTVINAIEKLNDLRVVDFAWNDPTDKAINNRNCRGRWTGLIAQEVVNVLPLAVNAPRPDGSEIDYSSPDYWFIEYYNMVPVLIKAIQELSERMRMLEAR